MKTDTELIEAYLNIHSTGRLTQTIIALMHLKQDLLKIHKQLPVRLSLPEEPHSNIWHYYRFLTITPAIHGNKLILGINVPLVNLDSGINLYNIQSSHIPSQIGKSLQCLLEGTNLAITKDNKYATVLSDTELITCTLAEGHF